MKFLKMMLISFAVLAVFLSAPRVGYSAPITFTGIDGVDVGPPFTNSSLAASNFDAAVALLGTPNVITFESATVGSNSFTAATGVVVSYSGEYQNLPTSPVYYSGVNADASLFLNNAWGFNTTTGGSQYLGFAPVGTVGRTDPVTASITFSFATPINAFGGYFTGLEDILGPVTLNYVTSGGSYSLEIGKPPTAWDDQGIRFFGITDTDSITQITLTEIIPGGSTQTDFWGLDDVRFASSSVASVPEPSTMALLGMGLAGLFGYGRRRMKK